MYSNEIRSVISIIILEISICGNRLPEEDKTVDLPPKDEHLVIKTRIHELI